VSRCFCRFGSKDQIKSFLGTCGRIDSANWIFGHRFQSGDSFFKAECLGRIQKRTPIHLCDLKFSADGVVVNVRKSKTDQESAGREVGLPFGASHDTWPVRALRLWLDRAAIREGPVLRAVQRYGHVSRRGLHRDSIGKLLKRAAGRRDGRSRSSAGTRTGQAASSRPQ